MSRIRTSSTGSFLRGLLTVALALTGLLSMGCHSWRVVTVGTPGIQGLREGDQDLRLSFPDGEIVLAAGSWTQSNASVTGQVKAARDLQGRDVRTGRLPGELEARNSTGFQTFDLKAVRSAEVRHADRRKSELLSLIITVLSLVLLGTARPWGGL